MKKIIAIILCVVMVLALCACGKSGTIEGDEAQAVVDAIQKEADDIAKEAGVPIDGQMAGLANPMTEYVSLDEINGIVGSALVHPPVMGVSDETFYVIDCGDFSIAQYGFTVAGVSYTFRCAPVMDRDISGIYVGEGTAFGDTPSPDPIECCFVDGVKASRWFTMDGQYVFMADNPEVLDEDTFVSVTEELYNLTRSGMSDAEFEAFYANLAGSWYDTVSQRAMAEIVANGSDSITVTVFWSSSAAEHNEWTMTAKLSEDGLLYYNDLSAKIVTYTSETEFTEEPYDFPASGWFSCSADGLLHWDGAGDDMCVECVFERY